MPILHRTSFSQLTQTVQTILVRLNDHTMWQSSNEGYSWNQLFSERRILAFYHHKYSSDRAYLITDTEEFFYTTDTGRNWYSNNAPSPPNMFGAQVIRFHPNTDYLIWVGNKDCVSGTGASCRAEAQYSRDNGRHWSLIDSYVRNCAFAKDSQIDADPSEIICESYRDKAGNQRMLEARSPMELVVGSNFYDKKSKLFDWVVGFAKFSEFLVVAEVSLFDLLRRYWIGCLRLSSYRCFLRGGPWNCRFLWMASISPMGSSHLACTPRLMYVHALCLLSDTLSDAVIFHRPTPFSNPAPRRSSCT